jgi:hypothetical protein
MHEDESGPGVSSAADGSGETSGASNATSGSSDTDGGTDADSSTGDEGSTGEPGADETGDEESSSGEVPCEHAAECDNGLWCDGVEDCVDGVCVNGVAPCDDGVACTQDACDEVAQTCDHVPDDAACDNGLHCDGQETCDAALGCQPGESVVCDPHAVACMVGACSEQAQGCVYQPNDGLCDNGLYCDGQETCDPVQGCQAGTPIHCDDGVACTADACSEQVQGCVHTPDDGLCPCGETCDPNAGCGNHCVITTCQGHLYECGDCIDNDGDCLIDMNDPNCWGPCDNNESGWKGEVPGQQSQSTCLIMDCYFDQDSGHGNDDCYWSHRCDPLEPMGCNYNPNTNIPGTSAGCADLHQTQSDQCLDFCGPLTPNGCDCFGCCDVYLDGQQDPVTVYLGTEGPSGQGTCNIDTAGDPSLCHPCTQVLGCLNACTECELCIGQDTLPDHCDEEDQCPGGEQPCGLAGQDPCNQGTFCLTGCCVPIPQ